MHRIGAILSVLGATACAAGKYGDYAADASQTISTEDGSLTGTSLSDTAGEARTPVWWTLDGTWMSNAGVVDGLTTTVALTLLDAKGVPVCVHTGPIAAVESLAVPADGLLSWWTLTLAVQEDCPIPNPIRLGFGPPDPRLDAAAAQAGLPSASLNAFFVEGPDTLWLAGVAGTPPQFDGSEPAATVAPPPDGPWRMQSLYLLPL
jgi:hypothetical protein